MTGLTDIAELVLGAALDLARFEMADPVWQALLPWSTVEERTSREFITVAYGKLGGLELGYGSDLDIVFLHDSAGERQQTDGGKTLDNATFFVRLAQRDHSHPHDVDVNSGGLYEVDTRLRPNGKSGPPRIRVSPRSSATSRTRGMDLGAPGAAARPCSIRRAQRCATRPSSAVQDRRYSRSHVHWETLRDDVVDMRQQDAQVSSARRPPTMFDLKQGEGGVTDIEFMVQYLVLNEARNASRTSSSIPTTSVSSRR